MPLWPPTWGKAHPKSGTHPPTCASPSGLGEGPHPSYLVLTVSAVTQIPAAYQCLGHEHGFQECPFLVSLQPGSLKMTDAQGFLSTNLYLKSYKLSLATEAGTRGLQGRILKQKKTSWHQENISRTIQSWLALI